MQKVAVLSGPGRGHHRVFTGLPGSRSLLGRAGLDKTDLGVEGSSLVVGCPATPPAVFSTHDTASFPEPSSGGWDGGEEHGPPKV